MVRFPLLLIPLAIYNIIVWLMPDVSFADPLAKLTLVSGAVWAITLGDILIALGVVLLLLEVMKGARPGAKYLTDHLLSLVVFAAAAAEFVMWPKFGSSIYFLLTLLALVEFLSGVSLHTRRGRVVVVPAVVEPRPPPRRRLPSIMPKPSRPVSRARRSPRPICSRTPVRRRRPTSLDRFLDHLTRALAGRADGAPRRAIGRQRIRGRRAPQVAGLRHLLGGRDQLRDKARIGTGQRQLARPSEFLGERDQRDAGRLHVREDAVFYFLFVNAGHRKPSQSGTLGPPRFDFRK
jgi:hypothetical protein